MLRKTIARVHDIVKQASKAQEDQYIGLKPITNLFKTNDEVLARNFVAKFPNPNWTEPYKVRKAFGVNVQVEGTGKRFPTFHVNNAKLFKKAESPEDADTPVLETNDQASALEEERSEVGSTAMTSCWNRTMELLMIAERKRLFSVRQCCHQMTT